MSVDTGSYELGIVFPRSEPTLKYKPPSIITLAMFTSKSRKTRIQILVILEY